MQKEKFIINQGYNDINPISCGSEQCAPGHYYGPAARSNYLLHFVVSGKGIFSTARGRYELGANQLFVIRPNEITYYEADGIDPWRYIWIGFNVSVQLPEALAKQDIITAAELRELFYDSVSAPDSQSGNAGYEAFLCSKIWEMFSLLARRDSEPVTGAERYVESAVAIMESEYGNALTVTDIAKRLHLNRSYLSVLFHSHTGRSPARYLTDIRMERALSLMRDYGYNVSVTALSVGFPDIFSFSRAFKRYFGVSPADFCRKSREKE